MTLVASATHLPVLKAACLNVPLGPILELGVGEGSTPFLSKVSRTHQREVWSFDNNAEWLDKYATLYASSRHHFCALPDWNHVPIERSLWSVAFVDQSPGADRAPSIYRLMYSARVIVAHDSEPKHNTCYRYDTIYDKFRYRKHYEVLFPHTVLLSNFVDVREWEVGPWTD